MFHQLSGWFLIGTLLEFIGIMFLYAGFFFAAAKTRNETELAIAWETYERDHQLDRYTQTPKPKYSKPWFINP